VSVSDGSKSDAEMEDEELTDDKSDEKKDASDAKVVEEIDASDAKVVEEIDAKDATVVEDIDAKEEKEVSQDNDANPLEGEKQLASKSDAKKDVTSDAKKDEEKSERKETSVVADDDDSDIEMVEEKVAKEPAKAKKSDSKAKSDGKDEPELVELSSDEEEAEEEEESEEEESDDDEVGDPSKPPGEGASRDIDPDHLMPFHHGWRREVVMRWKDSKDAAASSCDVYYIPPEDSEYRTREAKRKRRSKMDQDQYFEDFPHKLLSIQHFNYVRRPLGLANAAYEIIRKARKGRKPSPTRRRGAGSAAGASGDSGKDSGDGGGKSTKQRYKNEDPDSMFYEDAGDDGNCSLEEAEDDEVAAIMSGFHLRIPLTLQKDNRIQGLREERKKRKKHRDPETACTPPLAEDLLWSAMDDDPLGVHTGLGGRSSPSTPPPLRAVKLTPATTAEKITQLIQQIKESVVVSAEEAAASAALAAVGLEPTSSSSPSSSSTTTTTSNKDKDAQTAQKGGSAAASSASGPPIAKQPESQEHLASHDYKIRKYKHVRPMNYRAAFAKNHMGSIRKSGGGSSSVSSSAAEKRRCRPQQLMSQHGTKSSSLLFEKMKHLKGVSIAPVENGGGPSGSVKIRLPMAVVNGKRPVVELVMLQSGKYRPIKFSNNMTITEVIPKRIFTQATSLRKTIYQRARQIPHVGNKPIYLAINPGAGSAILGSSASSSSKSSATSSSSKPSSSSSSSAANSEQVSILVRLARTNSKPVLLNVPRKVAMKVKKGTTLSFSASNDQKYIVVDNTIHPPLKSGTAAAGTTGRQQHPQQQQPRQRGTGFNSRLPPVLAAAAASAGRPIHQQNRASQAMHYQKIRQPGMPVNLPGGLSIHRTSASAAGGHRSGSSSSSLPLPPALHRPMGGGGNRRNRQMPSASSSVLSSGEVVQSAECSAMAPCTPYCPGVTGFPELECRGCQSLFHGKCVGIPQTAINRIQGSWMCQMCKQMSLPPAAPPSRARPPPPRPSAIEVVDLD